MHDIKRVLVVGGGIGGLCAAIALRREGFDVDLVEIKSKWTVYGVGIIQQSNVVREMARLGVLDSYLEMAYAFDDVGLYDCEGVFQARVQGRRLAGPQYPANVGISRLALHRVLSDTANALGAEVRLGLTVASCFEDNDGIDVVFTDGSTARYDLVVGADGVYSKMRELLFGERYQPRFTGQAVWRHNFSRQPEIDHLATFTGAEGNAGLVPITHDLMYMFLTSCEPGNPRMEPSRLAESMQARLKGFGGLVAELAVDICDSAEVVYRPLEVVFVNENWFRGRVLLIGDAAHAATPHLGQGAGMAIEDAIVLSEELKGTDPLDTKLRRFMARRFERCKFISEMSILAGEREMAKDPDFDRARLTAEMLQLTAQPI